VDEGFDDPRMKAAVRRVWAGESAPIDLRLRIERMLRDASPANQPLVEKPVHRPRPTHQPMRMPRLVPGRWPGFAIAAAVLLTFGTGAWMLTNGDQTEKQVAFPYTLVAGIVQTHDRLSQAPNEHFLPEKVAGDFTTIGSRLSTELRIPVISAPLDNWQFIGASRVMVLGHPSASLLYRHGKQTLSILSMPLTASTPSAYDENYVVIMGSHEVAGFVKYSGLYCIVMDSPADGPNLDEARQLRNQLQREFPAVFEFNEQAAGAPTLLSVPAESGR
jgi:hypothetical protein